MDEIIFRTSQKLENLQIQFALTAQQSQLFFQSLTQRSIAQAREAWNNPKFEHIHEYIREIIARFAELTEQTSDYLLTNLRLNKFVDAFMRLLKFEISRTQLICGCTGFVIGAICGYCYAIFSAKPTIIAPHMKAVVCTNYGGIESAAFVEDIPQPKILEADDILIQVKASSVTNTDVAICNGYGQKIRKLLSKYNYTNTEFPITLGRSCSGIILEIGQKVSRLEIGDEVYLTSPFWAPGTASEIIIAKENLVSHKPHRIGFEGSAGLPYAGGQALMLLKSAGINQLNAQDKRILICGSSTPVACVLIQYCHLLLADITAISNMKAAPVAKALGANDIIVYHDQVTSKTDLEIDKTKLILKELELRESFHFIFVTSDLGLDTEMLMKFCKIEGSVHYSLPKFFISDNYGFFSGTIYSSFVRMKCTLQNIFGWRRSNFGEIEIDYRQLDILSELVDKNQLHSVVDKVFHPQDIEHALEHVQSSESIGSTIITFR